MDSRVLSRVWRTGSRFGSGSYAEPATTRRARKKNLVINEEKRAMDLSRALRRRAGAGRSGGPAGEELPEELVAFAGDPRGGLDVGLGAGCGVELGEGDAGLQILFCIGRALQRLEERGGQPGRIVALGPPLASLLRLCC